MPEATSGRDGCTAGHFGVFRTGDLLSKGKRRLLHPLRDENRRSNSARTPQRQQRGLRQSRHLRTNRRTPPCRPDQHRLELTNHLGGKVNPSAVGTRLLKFGPRGWGVFPALLIIRGVRAHAAARSVVSTATELPGPCVGEMGRHLDAGRRSGSQTSRSSSSRIRSNIER